MPRAVFEAHIRLGHVMSDIANLEHDILGAIAHASDEASLEEDETVLVADLNELN